MTSTEIYRPDFSKIVRNRDIGAEPMEGEKPKTAEQVKYVKVLQDIIADELKELGVWGDILPVSRVHFIEANGGTYNTGETSAIVPPGERGRTLSILAEEMLHAASSHPHLFDTRRPDYSAREIGYNYVVNDNWFFVGLTEGVTNILKINMLKKNFGRLTQEFDLNTEEQQNLIPQGVNDDDYPLYRKIVQRVAWRIGGMRKDEQIVQEIQRGLFARDYTPYRWLRENLDRDGFEMLAYLNVNLGFSDNCIADYFLTDILQGSPSASSVQVSEVKPLREPAYKKMVEQLGIKA